MKFIIAFNFAHNGVTFERSDQAVSKEELLARPAGIDEAGKLVPALTSSDIDHWERRGALVRVTEAAPGAAARSTPRKPQAGATEPT